MTERRRQAAAEERELLRDVVHAHHVVAFNEEFCVLVSHLTPYRRLTVKMIFPEGYPEQRLSFELKSDCIPEKLLARLASMAEEMLDSEVQKGKVESQVVILYSYLDEMIHENKLLWAGPEIRKLRATSKQVQGIRLKIDDRKGSIAVKATSSKYVLNYSLHVPDGYPEEQVAISIDRTNLPNSFVQTMKAQVNEISRKCSVGYAPERAVSSTTSLQGRGDIAASSIGAPDVQEAKLTTSHLRDLKHDVNFLKHASDLREIDASFNKMLQKFNYGVLERKAARRELKKLSAKEREKEIRQVEKAAAEMEELQLKRWRDAVGLGASPQRSLEGIVDFVLNGFFFKLTKGTCPISEKQLVPEEPRELKVLVEQKKKGRPICVPTCGCWCIYSELHNFITTPPFEKPCPRCGGMSVTHPDWTSDVKQLEKAWAMKQAKKRELAEVSDCFGLGDEFLK